MINFHGDEKLQCLETTINMMKTNRCFGRRASVAQAVKDPPSSSNRKESNSSFAFKEIHMKTVCFGFDLIGTWTGFLLF